jgi:regulatory protein
VRAARRRTAGRPAGSGDDLEGGRDDHPDADPVEVGRAVALRMLERQPRTRAELARGLSRRGVPPEAVEAVLDRFAEVGLVDDEAFAAAWVRTRHAGRGLARRALAAELRQRGVDADTVSSALAEVSADDEEAAARALVARRLAALARLPVEVQQRRLVGMLARKGFGAGLAGRVVREALAPAHDDADE